MDLVILIFALALIGFLVYWVTTNIPMGPHWAMMIKIVVFLVVLFYLLKRFNLLPDNIM